MHKIYLLFGLLSLTLSLAVKPSIAQNNPTEPLLPDVEPLDLSLLQEDVVIPPGVITPQTISQTGLTEPSLWWAEEQFGNSLIETWLAYPGEDPQPGGRVDLVVNRQIWSLLDYLQRYAFVHHMGTVARDFRYNTRIFNTQGDALATYTCDFSVPQTPNCNIQFYSSGRVGLQGPRDSTIFPPR